MNHVRARVGCASGDSFVRITAGPAASLLEERAEQRLRCNSYLALKNITCEIEQGTLILRGQLPTYYLKQIASTAVADLDGVERVINQIEVVSHRRDFELHTR